MTGHPEPVRWAVLLLQAARSPTKRLAPSTQMTTPFLQKTTKRQRQSPGPCQVAFGGYNDISANSAAAMGRFDLYCPLYCTGAGTFCQGLFYDGARLSRCPMAVNQLFSLLARERQPHRE